MTLAERLLEALEQLFADLEDLRPISSCELGALARPLLAQHERGQRLGIGELLALAFVRIALLTRERHEQR